MADVNIKLRLDLSELPAAMQQAIGLMLKGGAQAGASFNASMQDVTAAEEQATVVTAQHAQAQRVAAEATGHVTDRTHSMAGAMQNAFFAINVVKDVAGILQSTFGGLVGSINSAEEAEAKLARAQENRGLRTEQSIEDAKAYAAELQKLTGIADDDILTTMAQLTAMGLHGDQLKQATKLSADLAAVMGTDMRSAARVMADAFEGNTGMLGRYVKGLDETDIKQRGSISIIEQLTEAVGGQAEAMGATNAGKMRVFTAQLDDMKEVLGGLLVGAMIPLIGAGTNIVQWFIDAGPFVQGFVGTVGMLTAAFVVLRVTGIGEAVSSLFSFVRTLPGLISGLWTTTAAAGATTGAFTALNLASGGILIAMGLIVAATVGVTNAYGAQERGLKSVASAAVDASDALERYRNASEEKTTAEFTADVQTLNREIFYFSQRIEQLKESRRAMLAEAAKSGSLRTAEVEDAKRQYDADILSFEQKRAFAERLKKEAEGNIARLDDEAKHTNVLAEAKERLKKAQEKLEGKDLSEADIAAVNREIERSQAEVDRLEELGKKKKEEKPEKLNEMAGPLYQDILPAADSIAEQRELVKKLQTDLEKASAGERPELLVRLRLEEKELERLEKSVEAKEVFPAGSILAQQKRLKDAQDELAKAQTDAARRSAQERLDAEQKLYDRMTMSANEYAERERRLQEERRRQWIETHQVAMAALDGVSSGVNTMWSEFIVKDRQAKDSWDAVWLSMRNTALRALGQILAQEVSNALVSVGVHTTAEGAKTAATSTGVLARIGFLAMEVGKTLLAGAASMVNAVAKSIEWLAGILGPAAFLAVPITIGASVAAYAGAKAAFGFRRGGVIEEGETGFFEGEEREVIAPEKTFIEVMKTEILPKILTQILPMPVPALSGIPATLPRIPEVSTGRLARTMEQQRQTERQADAASMKGVEKKLDRLMRAFENMELRGDGRDLYVVVRKQTELEDRSKA